MRLALDNVEGDPGLGPYVYPNNWPDFGDDGILYAVALFLLGSIDNYGRVGVYRGLFRIVWDVAHGNVSGE